MVWARRRVWDTNGRDTAAFPVRSREIPVWKHAGGLGRPLDRGRGLASARSLYPVASALREQRLDQHLRARLVYRPGDLRTRQPAVADAGAQRRRWVRLSLRSAGLDARGAPVVDPERVVGEPAP